MHDRRRARPSIDAPPITSAAPAGSVRAVFQPNAPGRRELSCLAALQQRQLLKGRLQYLDERVRIAVDGPTVELRSILLGGFPGRCLGRFGLDSLLALPVEPLGPEDPRWPAFLLVDLRRGRFLAELRAIEDDEDSRAVLQRLTT